MNGTGTIMPQLCHCGQPATIFTCDGIGPMRPLCAKHGPSMLQPARTELQVFIAMLERAGIGHGLRNDYNPDGTGVQVEHEDADDEGWFETDWQFDAEGKLTRVTHYRGEVG